MIRLSLLTLWLCVTSSASTFTSEYWHEEKEKKEEEIASEVSLSYPYISKRFSIPARGFGKLDLDPSFQLSGGIKIASGKEAHHTFAWYLRPNLAVTRLGGSAMGGLDTGLRFSRENLELDVGLGVQSQKMGQLAGTQFDVAWYEVYGGVRYRSERLVVGLDLEALSVDSKELAALEGITTKMSRAGTYVGSPHVIFFPLPFLSLLGGVKLYSLGRTAVASKEFAFYIDTKSLTTGIVGAGLHIGPVEAKLYGTFLIGNFDEVEQYFQAPFLVKHYLLANQSITAEVKCNF